MSEKKRGSYRSMGRVFIGHFVICSFLGLLTVKGLIVLAAPLNLENSVPLLIGVAILTGLIVAVLVRVIHHGKVRRLDPLVYPGDDDAYRRASMWSGFVCGAMVILASINIIGLMVLTGMTLLAISLGIKTFFRRVSALIRPGRFAHIQDVILLISVFATLLISFTLVNFCINQMYVVLADSPNTDISGSAFRARDGSILDYLYFSVVLMTTVGFGDISPIKPVAKVAVSVECMVSYVMFALMVGIIMRGIIFEDDEEGQDG